MPIWFELMVLLLAAYAIGLAIGWLVWGRNAAIGADLNDNEVEEDTTL